MSDDAAPLSFDNATDKIMLRMLRNRYFHFSAHYDDKAFYVYPHKPRRKGNVRLRKIQSG